MDTDTPACSCNEDASLRTMYTLDGMGKSVCDVLTLQRAPEIASWMVAVQDLQLQHPPGDIAYGSQQLTLQWRPSDQPA